MTTKTIKIECRTWTLLKERRIKKPNGDWETFGEVIRRLLNEYKEDEKMASKTQMIITKEDQKEIWLIKKKLGFVKGKMPQFKEECVGVLLG